MIVRCLCLRGQSLSLVEAMRYNFRGDHWRGPFVIIKGGAVKNLNGHSSNCVSHIQIIILRTYIIKLGTLDGGIILIVSLELFFHVIYPLRVFEWFQIRFELAQLSNSFFGSGDHSNDFSVILVSLDQLLEVPELLWYDNHRFICWKFFEFESIPFCLILWVYKFKIFLENGMLRRLLIQEALLK